MTVLRTFSDCDRANELFVGRVAQLGFAASLIGEGLTEKGILGQIGGEQALSISSLSVDS